MARISASVSGATRKPSGAGAETGNPENSHRILGEGGRDMTQPAAFEIVEAMIGIDQPALAVAGHGVDSQIAAQQIVFQPHLGRGVEAEAMIARRGLAFGTGQRVFLAGLRMQKYRKILADRLKAARQQLLRRRADHHPVAFRDWQAQ
jgi:hypothetical protein